MERHVVFNYSAVGGLRAALGPEISIARFSDDLSYGPINPPDALSRRNWTGTNLGYDNADITGDEQTFWPHVLKPEAGRVAWFSRRNAKEYCGFLEYLRRLGDLPTDIVDVTEARTEDGTCFRSVATIPAKYIQQAGKRRPLAMPERTNFLALWNKLRAEATELRIISDNLSPESVSLSYYDNDLLALIGKEWRPMVLVLSDALVRWPVEDLFLISRLYELADAGLLALRDTDRRHPDVRRTFE